MNMINLPSFATMAVAIAIAAAGIFSNNNGALAQKVDTLTAQQASTAATYAQYSKSTDDRLTRIENKLDQAINAQLAKTK